MNFFTELIKRYNSESPVFFRKASKRGLWLIGIGVAIAGIPAAINVTLETTHIDLGSSFDLSFLLKVAGYFIAFGTGVTMIANAACKNPDEISK